MRGSNRSRKPGRREPFRDPRPVMLVLCEGEITERQYIERFAIHRENPRVKVRVAKETGVPLSLVAAARRYKHEAEEAARRERDENLAYDSVWCVFDIDEHPNVPEARDMARANGVELAVSNPCFELWLLLHFRDVPGMSHRHDVQAMLKKIIKNYDKHVDFARYAQGYRSAVERAKRLDVLAESMNDPGRNPTTSVHRLVESIVGGEKYADEVE